MPFAVRTAVDEGRLRELMARGKKAGISEEFMIRVNVSGAGAGSHVAVTT
jgi:hypothetical protein